MNDIESMITELGSLMNDRCFDQAAALLDDIESHPSFTRAHQRRVSGYLRILANMNEEEF